MLLYSGVINKDDIATRFCSYAYPKSCREVYMLKVLCDDISKLEEYRQKIELQWNRNITHSKLFNAIILASLEQAKANPIQFKEKINFYNIKFFSEQGKATPSGASVVAQ
jgi:hypothetical protein